MNSCSDLALNFVSGSCIVTYRINTRIREVLKKSQLKMGRDLNACFICMFCRAAGLRSALIIVLAGVLAYVGFGAVVCH